MSESRTLLPPAGEIVVAVLTLLVLVALVAGVVLLVRKAWKAHTRRNR